MCCCGVFLLWSLSLCVSLFLSVCLSVCLSLVDVVVSLLLSMSMCVSIMVRVGRVGLRVIVVAVVSECAFKCVYVHCTNG